ncbi:MAG: response regulator [Desulfuromonadaceae bacterium]|nr:response regulator [Desulfuromonadaceae bacterium]
MTYLSLIQNISLLVALTFIHCLLIRQFRGNDREYQLASGVSFRSVSVDGGRFYTDVIRILLAEDDSINQLVTKKILIRSGYQVDVAGNGSEALKLLGENDYAIVLMDCMMPVMNGYETTAVIRDLTSKVRNHAIPIVALTANAFKKDRDRCLAAGMDDYLSKPLEIADLLAVLKKWTASCSAQERDCQGTITGKIEKYCGSTIDVFDMAEFVRRNLSDLKLSRDVAAVFIQHGPEYLREISTAVSAGDVTSLLQSAHKLKGAAANLALVRLRDSAAAVEAAARTGNIELAAALPPELNIVYDQAATAMREQFGIVVPDLER